MMTISGVVALTILATFIWCLMGVGTVTLLRMARGAIIPKAAGILWPAVLLLAAFGLYDHG